jgi:hypothetical protein
MRLLYCHQNSNCRDTKGSHRGYSQRLVDQRRGVGGSLRPCIEHSSLGEYLSVGVGDLTFYGGSPKRISAC